MMISQLSAFEKRVLEGLSLCGVDLQDFPPQKNLGAAVSGGADSVSLLLSLARIAACYKVPLKVITVNHFIRPDEETCADVQFVVQMCRGLCAQGFDVECEVAELEKGSVSALAKNRGCGVEEAARFLRYQKFEEFCKKKSVAFLCLAHNQNDQLETLLMRFLQGSFLEAMGGIQRQRDFYVRPLLEIPRTDIERYLCENDISWRTDKTNFDTNYLRNKIRNVLVPVLDGHFAGWKQGVLTGAQKSLCDGSLLNQLVNDVQISELQNENVVFISRDVFSALPDSIKVRVLLKMCNKLGFDSRIPYQFFCDFLTAASTAREDFVKRYKNLEISQKKEHVFVKKADKIHTDLVFFDIIKTAGSYDFPFGTLFVSESGEILINNVPAGLCVSFPFCVRNQTYGDEVLCADGNMKTVADVFADWKIPAEKRSFVPLVLPLGEQDWRREIKAVLAGFLGYKDWIVR